MKKTMMAVALALGVLSIQPVLAAEYSEKTQYLGVVNGQVVGNSVVKVTRTPTDPVLYRSGGTTPSRQPDHPQRRIQDCIRWLGVYHGEAGVAG